MLHIKIPKPCHEDWNAMTPTSRGAFCGVCAKDVVDFTAMSDDEVQQYLINRSGDKVCGKFNNTQLQQIRINIPNRIFYAKIADWKKFMAVVMLAFGSMLFGCDVTTDRPTSNVIVNQPEMQDRELLGNTIFTPPTLGTPAVNYCGTTKGEPALLEEIEGTTTGVFMTPPTFTTIGYTPPFIRGDIELMPVRPSIPPTIDSNTLPPVPVLENEFYGFVGMLVINDSTVKKNKKDSVPKPKTVVDTLECKSEHFY